MQIELPDDIVRLIYAKIRADIRRNRAALRIQTAFKRYRVQTLMTRYRVLRHIWLFREYNIFATVFITKARL